MAHSTQVKGKSKWQLHFTHLWGRDYGDKNGWFSLLPDDWSPASTTYDVVMRMYYNFTQQ